MLNVLTSDDYKISGPENYSDIVEFDIEKLNNALEQQGYVCIPKEEYEQLKEEKEKLEQELAQEIAGEDW